MKDLHKFVIETDSSGYATKVTIDGQEVKGILRLTLDIDASMRPPTLSLEIYPGTVTVNGKGVIEVSGREL